MQLASIFSADDFVAAAPTAFETERLILLPLKPPYARALVASLLTNEAVARTVPWMKDRSADAAVREAFRIELQCSSGQSCTWGIVQREQQVLMGAVLASASLAGTDLEVLLAPEYWGQGIPDEATGPVLEWLSEEGPIGFGVQ